MAKFPARVHPILAREANTAVIIRRGPSKSAHASVDPPVGSGGCYDTHRLLHLESGTVVDHPEWEWAELDRKRLVWVTEGVLYAAKIHGKGLGEVKSLHDFSDMAFEAMAAPY